MRSFLIAASLAVLSATAAFAADDSTIATRFGNTVVAKGTFGEVHLYFNADHSFTGKVVSMNYGLKGSWKIDGDNLCLTYDPVPPGMINPSCAPIAAHKVGESWTANGRAISLVQGIQ
jgi:opacity protein-like surface antigen